MQPPPAALEPPKGERLVGPDELNVSWGFALFGGGGGGAVELPLLLELPFVFGGGFGSFFVESFRNCKIKRSRCGWLSFRQKS